MHVKRRWGRLLAATAAAAPAAGWLSCTALAIDRSWNVASGTWSIAADWNPSGMPVAGDLNVAFHGAFAEVHQSAGTVSVGGRIRLGYSSGGLTVAGTGVYDQSAGVLGASGMALGDLGEFAFEVAPIGIFNLSNFAT